MTRCRSSAARMTWIRLTPCWSSPTSKENSRSRFRTVPWVGRSSAASARWRISLRGSNPDPKRAHRKCAPETSEPAMSDINVILDRLPHKPPFRFVTALTMLEPGVTGMGDWSIRGDEEFFRGHFPGEPIVPGVLLAESLAQLAGLTQFADQP